MPDDWKIIGQLTDKSVLGKEGLSDAPFMRKARAILFNAEGDIALMYEKSTCHHALPGGGMECGEDEWSAIRREIVEETGCTCDSIEKLGIITENRAHTGRRILTYYFVVRTVGNTAEPCFTDEEIELGTELKWCKMEEAVRLLSMDCADTNQMKFLQARDLIALEEYGRLYTS